MENIVLLELLEIRRKDLIQKGIFNAPGIDSQTIHWITNHTVRRITIQDHTVPFVRRLTGKNGLIITRGMFEILTQETENQINQDAYTYGMYKSEDKKESNKLLGIKTQIKFLYGVKLFSYLIKSKRRGIITQNELIRFNYKYNLPIGFSLFIGQPFSNTKEPILTALDKTD